MDALDDVLAVIDRKLAESQAEMNKLSQQVKTLTQVKTLLASGAVTNLLNTQ